MVRLKADRTVQNQRVRGARVTICILAAVYLTFIAASHAVPLDAGLEVPLVLVPWLVLGATGILSRFRAGSQPTMPWWRLLIEPWPLTLAFAVVVGAAAASAFSGNLSFECPAGADSCIKLNDWRVADQRFYRRFPYDAYGDRDPAQPWVEISAQTYVGEVGTKLRTAAAFGLFELCVGWIVSTGLARKAPP
jgi:hypothetical protein